MPLQSILFFGDVHAPFEDKRAMRLVLEVARTLQPHHLVCMGDLMDCYSVSSHSKDPSRKADLAWEVGYTEGILDAFDALGVKGQKHFIEGNHEHRLQRFIADKAPMFEGLVSIPQVLGLKARGWTFTPYRTHTTLGKLVLTHDVGYAGRYAAHRTLDALQHSVVTGHTHRISAVVESNLMGEPKIAASFGWLGDANSIDYMHKGKVTRDWALGFGIGTLDPKTGFVQLTPIPILQDGKKLTCMVEGTKFDV